MSGRTIALGRVAPRSRGAVRSVSRARSRATTQSANYWLLIGIVAVLNVIGLVMVLSASSVVALTSTGSAWYFFQRQLLWALLAVVAFVVVAHTAEETWRRLARPLLVGSTALLVVVLVPGIGIYVSGSRRWLGIDAWRFQPSELAKLALLLFAADLITRREHELGDWRRVLRPIMCVLAAVAGLVYLEPDLDSTLLLAVIVGAVLVVGGIRLRHLMVIASVGCAFASALVVAAPYRRARLLTFLHPEADVSNTGYQILQSLIAFGSGGWTGSGLGAGRAKWHFLPNAHTDFIFSVIGEELGLFGSLLVLSLFVAFAVIGIRIALRASTRFGSILAAGVTVWIVVQAAINICGTIGLLPVSGIPLPFVSFGGSSLVFTMIGAGMLASVARNTR